MHTQACFRYGDLFSSQFPFFCVLVVYVTFTERDTGDHSYCVVFGIALTYLLFLQVYARLEHRRRAAEGQCRGSVL